MKLQVFGIFNTLAYGFGAYILHNDYKATPPELQWVSPSIEKLCCMETIGLKKNTTIRQSGNDLDALSADKPIIDNLINDVNVCHKYK